MKNIQILAFLVLSTTFAFANELWYFRQLETIDGSSAKVSGFFPLTNELCGSVVINNDRTKILTAFHCIESHLDQFSRTKGRVPILPTKEAKKIHGSVVSLGACYKQPEFEENSPFKLLAYGGCNAGYTIEDLDEWYSKSDVINHFDLVTKDWAIVEVEFALEQSCSAIRKEFDFEEPIVAYGYPNLEDEDVNFGGLNFNLSQYVGMEAKGFILDKSFRMDSNYNFKAAWSNKTTEVFDKFISDKRLILSSAPVIKGFSGGPIKDIVGNLIGITTMVLQSRSASLYLPNWGSHVVIPVSEIIRQAPEVQRHFDCSH